MGLVTCIKTNTKFSYKQKAEDKNKCRIHLLGGNFVWGSTKIHYVRLLFSIFLCGLFIIINETDLTSYVDDTTPYVETSNLDYAITSREKNSNNPHYFKTVQIRSFFWSVFFRIRTEYGKILRISPYSVRKRENTDRKKLRIWILFRQCCSNGFLIAK